MSPAARDRLRPPMATTGTPSTSSPARLDAAVQRIEDGTYGVCARCGNLIGEARLDALPGARTCIGCAG